MSDLDNRWVAVQIRIRCEKTVAERLAFHGYELSMDANNISYLHVSSWFSSKLSGNLDREAFKQSIHSTAKMNLDYYA